MLWSRFLISSKCSRYAFNSSFAAKAVSETSTLFRNEDSGEMHGLTRVRQFTISEGHLIVRPDQMVEEFKQCIALAKYCLSTLGVEEDVTYHLSKWDPEHKLHIYLK